MVGVENPRRVRVGGGGAVAELALSVVTPGEDLAAAGERQAVVAPRGDLRHVAEGHAIGLNHQCRVVARRGRAVAQDAVAVVAPGQEPAVRAAREGMVEPRRHIHDAGDRRAVRIANPLRQGFVGVGAVAELAGAVVAPGPDGTVGT